VSDFTGGDVARVDTLRQELMSLVGVAAADVDGTGEAAPSGVRVRLVPGADARAVGVQVQRVLASHGLRSRVSDEEIVAPPERAAADEEPAVAKAPTVGLAAVTVEETPFGAAVTVTGSDGSRRSEDAEASEIGVARAIVSAVGVLVEGRAARLMWISREEAGDQAVVSLLIERGDGSRRAGAAIVRGGTPLAVARAAWDALAADSQGA
jgi:hypothetical protein